MSDEDILKDGIEIDWSNLVLMPDNKSLMSVGPFISGRGLLFIGLEVSAPRVPKRSSICIPCPCSCLARFKSGRLAGILTVR